MAVSGLAPSSTAIRPYEVRSDARKPPRAEPDAGHNRRRLALDIFV